MNQITHYRLWVGHAGDGRDTQGILARDIRAIVQLAIEEPPIELPRDMAYLRIPLVDGDGNDEALLRGLCSQLRFQPLSVVAEE